VAPRKLLDRHPRHEMLSAQLSPTLTSNTPSSPPRSPWTKPGSAPPGQPSVRGMHFNRQKGVRIQAAPTPGSGECPLPRGRSTSHAAIRRCSLLARSGDFFGPLMRRRRRDGGLCHGLGRPQSSVCGSVWSPSAVAAA
jgi:hypothetical protein